MSVVYRPGGFCDVTTLADGRFVHVYESGLFVVAELDGARLWQTQVPEPLMFCRCAFVAGSVVSIHQGHDTGRAWLVSRTGVKDLGLTFGVQPVAIDNTYAYVVRDSRTYDRIRLATGEVEHLPHGVPGSSQGIRDVRAGVVIWADNTQVAPFARGDWSIALHQFSVIDPLVVGQADPPQIAGVNARAGERFTAIEGEAYEPHIAQSGDKYAICARTPKGAAFTVVPPYPAFISGPLSPQAPPTVTPPKPEDPKPVPVQNRASQLAAFHQQYNGGQPITDDAEKHRFTAAFASALNKQDGDTRWGRKARAGSDAVSKDTLGYWLGPLVPHNPTDGKIDAFDIVESTGDVKWDTRAEQNDPLYRSIDARWFPVAAVSPQDPAPVPPQPPVTPDYERRLKAVEDAVSAIEAANSAERVAVAQLGEALRMLGEKPAPKYRATGTTSRVLGHSHTISVTLEPIA